MASASRTISSERGGAATSRTRIAERFAQLRAAGRRALVPYITAGHPDAERTVDLLRGLEHAGADVIEIGLPFSDPMADGPIIQASSQQALEGGMTFDRLLETVHRADVSIPLVLFSYLNPLIAAGTDALDRAADVGFSGVLVTDLPVGADPEREAWLGNAPLAFIRLVAPTTPQDRMREIATHGSGFVYLISRLGVTGLRDTLPPDLPATLDRLRAVAPLPICVGFGISRPEQASAVARIADGVVVGSAIVRAAGEENGVEQAVDLARRLRAAMDDA
jgi:tryptophan synthase alpha chain